MPHKSEDFKISAVKYYLHSNKGYSKRYLQEFTNRFYKRDVVYVKKSSRKSSKKSKTYKE